MNTTTAVALAIFILTYILLFAIEKARPYIALASAFIFAIERDHYSFFFRNSYRGFPVVCSPVGAYFSSP